MLLLPISTDTPIRRTPWVNYGLIGANVLAFMLVRSVLARSPGGQTVIDSLKLWADSPRWHQFLTSMFMHAGWWHLIGNMVFLWVFGNSLNTKLGNVTYLLFYLAAGLFAGAGYVMFQSHPVVGASGAVFGVAAGFLALFPLSRVTTLYFFFFIGVVELRGLVIVGYYVAYNVVCLLLGLDAGVAYLAHLAGALFGFVAAMLLLAIGAVGRDQFDLLALIRRWRMRQSYRAYMSDPTHQRQARYGRVARPVESQELASRPAADPRAEQIARLRRQLVAAVQGGDAAFATALYTDLRQLDPEQVLPAHWQLELGNYLMRHGQHGLAAQAYQDLLAHYPTFESAEQVELLLGVLHARYLDNPVRARHHLERCRDRLRDPGQQEFCRQELAHLAATLGGA